MTRYLAAFLGFAAVLVGVVGDTWNKKRRGLAKLTRIGRVAVFLAALSLGVTLVETNRDHRAIDWQTEQKGNVRRVANRQVREGVNHLLNPFCILLENIHHKRADLEIRAQSLVEDPRYVVSLLSNPSVRAEFESFDLRRSPENPGVFPVFLWWQLFSRNAQDADRVLNETVAKFSGYFDAEALVAIEELRSDEFFRMRLLDLSTLVSANDHLDAYPIAFAFMGREDYGALDSLLAKVTDVLDCLGEK